MCDYYWYFVALTMLFIGLKVGGAITWSWFWVLFPLIFPYVFGLCLMFVFLFIYLGCILFSKK